MAKAAQKSGPNKDLEGFDASTFSLTFAIEILGIDVWHDCNEGWLDLGPCSQGIKIQYQLYPGQNFDVDILIWPHVVKIWSGANSGWVRTWQFLDRRWLSFDIRHVFPVRVADLHAFVATVTPSFGLGVLSSNAKNDKVLEVYLPRLEFGQQRYFAPVVAAEKSLEAFLYDLIWKTVECYIPASYLDGLFDVPHPVTDVRHQDAILNYVKESTLNRNLIEEPVREMSSASRKTLVGSKKKIDMPKMKFEIYLSGNRILAGTGQQVPFETVGDRPPDLGEIIVFVSSQNLPAADDFPILFVNIDSLLDVPVDALKKYNISHLYTQWRIGEDTHDSERKAIGSEINFNDHHAIPVPCDVAPKVISMFMDDYFEIQLRGIRPAPNPNGDPQFFGYDKKDRNFGTNIPPPFKNYETDIILAATKIEARSLARGVSGVVQGEFPVFPPNIAVETLRRPTLCTNDQNGVRLPFNHIRVVPSYVILDAQMTLAVRMGYAGCRPQRLGRCYSRMICTISETWLVMEMLRLVSDINRAAEDGNRDEMLSGFAIDVGNLVIFYVEGLKDGVILQLWESFGDHYPHANPMFSSAARYSSRVYEDVTFAGTCMPFMLGKTFAPLSAFLALPPVYARPTLPVLARNAVLKFGRLLAFKQWWRLGPPTSDLPTPAELVSFRQELCVPPRPPNVLACSMLLGCDSMSVKFRDSNADK